MQMGSWYAHKLATTFSMSVAPAGSSATPYGERGWTTFERQVSQLIKGASYESWRRLADASVVRTVGPCGGAYIEPPMHPRAFAAALARKTFTNRRSDCGLRARARPRAMRRPSPACMHANLAAEIVCV